MDVSSKPGEGGGRKSVDTDLNLVPFIDVMSCLTAFLLITAVWTNVAGLDAGARGGERAGPPAGARDERLAVLIQPDATWVARPGGSLRRLEARDWVGLDLALGVHEGVLVEIAAEPGVAFQDIVTTMEVAQRRKAPVAYVHPGAVAPLFR
jgi:biopolymer transport protein ExbD